MTEKPAPGEKWNAVCEAAVIRSSSGAGFYTPISTAFTIPFFPFIFSKDLFGFSLLGFLGRRL